MPRFALLKHTVGGRAHYDLLLERGRVLKTWTLDAPLAEPVTHLRARARFDHPARFLTYEGPLSEGNGAVEAIDRGDYQRLEWRPEGEVFVHLRGRRFAGHLRLTRAEGEEWELGFLADPPRAPAAAEGAAPAEPMRIGEVARRSGLSREVINSYVMFGLVHETERTPSGQRLFGPEVLRRLRMIGLLKKRGYTLRDIREIFIKDK